MRVYVIGSISCVDRIKNVAEKFKALDNEVRYVKDEFGSLLNAIQNCYSIIEDWADLIVVVPKRYYPTIEIGNGVMYEIEHAKSFEKTVVIDTYI